MREGIFSGLHRQEDVHCIVHVLVCCWLPLFLKKWIAQFFGILGYSPFEDDLETMSSILWLYSCLHSKSQPLTWGLSRQYLLVRKLHTLESWKINHSEEHLSLIVVVFLQHVGGYSFVANEMSRYFASLMNLSKRRSLHVVSLHDPHFWCWCWERLNSNSVLRIQLVLVGYFSELCTWTCTLVWMQRRRWGTC